MACHILQLSQRAHSLCKFSVGGSLLQQYRLYISGEKTQFIQSIYWKILTNCGKGQKAFRPVFITVLSRKYDTSVTSTEMQTNENISSWLGY